ncbi:MULTISPECIES: autotransporter outer membrane beta-barrel domain-containing protein [unclassified Pseudomonas]|uniref:autotransporter outer membrane beta-barrel domain-containing protein n=1 Tax=unclassified Pseudomonas TaxID=196821 RepID=UPI001179CEF6|nr:MULTISPECIES: autotransporter outer membrane beta-barrel domain-containing protein [unclassified Pseudomonas]MDN4543998.1 autotransporter outer membrane beta-barrel domain-containing protein [Pseudomonas sp. C32]
MRARSGRRCDKWAEIGGGLSVAAKQNHHFYAEGGYTKGSDIEQPWAVTVGYRYNG